MKTTITIPALLIVFTLVACGGPSLEKYYVDNQEKDNFIVVNVPANMFIGNSSELSEEEKATLQSVNKANILAFPLTGENKASFEEEKTKLENILKDEKYKLLMKFGSGDKQFRLMYLGESNSVDEMIVYGAGDDVGFGVARILGDDMDPGKMIELMKSLKESDQLNMEQIKDLKDLFPKKEKDSL